ncbi:MAG: hypothetical protein FWB99_07145, partial [Treponema sp.]|nr:hypothetical protein [Treponema sp.]
MNKTRLLNNVITFTDPARAESRPVEFRINFKLKTAYGSFEHDNRQPTTDNRQPTTDNRQPT